MVMAAVKVVLPWSTCPIVPMFTCGLVRSNFALPIVQFLCKDSVRSCTRGLFLSDHFLGDRARNLLVVRRFHAKGGAPLAHRTHGGCIAEHLSQRHLGTN